MLNTREEIMCPVLRDKDDYHFEGVCEDCDVRRLSRMNLGQVEDHFSQGRVTRDQLDAYRWVWSYLSPHGGQPHWCSQPYTQDPDVQRIARKLLRTKGYVRESWPATLVETEPATGHR